FCQRTRYVEAQLFIFCSHSPLLISLCLFNFGFSFFLSHVHTVNPQSYVFILAPLHPPPPSFTRAVYFRFLEEKPTVK
uniref:Uncharacterized protein n=1 Tax=Acanthochromis polyacanthus TaxID=80966 RepID=A0A3Q1G1N9_9TELE